MGITVGKVSRDTVVNFGFEGMSIGSSGDGSVVRGVSLEPAGLFLVPGMSLNTCVNVVCSGAGGGSSGVA